MQKLFFIPLFSLLLTANPLTTEDLNTTVTDSNITVIDSNLSEAEMIQQRDCERTF